MNLHDQYTAAIEESTLQKWNLSNIYEHCKDMPIYDLMDGPPFISSASLHYGHLLVGYAKSTMNFYKLMKGYNIHGKIGYDCHGLPIEMEVNKLLDINNNEQVHTLGIDKYNKKCNDVIESYSGSWINIYSRIGRFIDPKHDYKTKDLNFMESVWWAFSELYKKDLAYQGYNVVPYSIGCNTSLSNFEAKENYKMKDDVSLYIKFPVINKQDTYFVAWTTTPWTVPSHLALAVNPKMVYVTLLDKESGNKYIIAESNIVNIYKNSDCYTKIDSITGVELVGTEYKQPFNYFENYRQRGAFRIYADNFVKVTSDEEESNNKKSKPVGTGIVHCAPAFGADDCNMCTKHFISPMDIGDVCPVDDNGCFTSTVSDYYGHNVFDINNKIIKDLKNMNVILKQENCKHKYPYCWRTDTPLIYKASKSFFIKVTAIKDKIIENNKKIHWIPEHVGSGRFNEWLKDTKDWGVSRSRFFGTPMPVWMSDDEQEIVVIGSIDELVQKAGLNYRPANIHPEFVNDILIPSSQGKGFLKRIPDVFDCWFESGSVPFAQHHYPMENQHIFDGKDFLAEFICEGVDQTRGWFYTLNVLSTALFNRPAFQHCISTGLILAGDGKKMSKRLKNYPDPFNIINKYGSDALRLYLINSPAIKAGNFCFNESGVFETKKLLVPWFESLKFLNSHVSNYIKQYETFNCNKYKDTTNVMDKWILSKLGSLVKFIETEMEDYKLYSILPLITESIDTITNWYLKLNRLRLKGINLDKDEWEITLSVLVHVLLTFAKIAAPFVPYLSEYMYQNLGKLNNNCLESIFMCSYPKSDDFVIETDVERKVDNLKYVIVQLRAIRNNCAKTKPEFGSCKLPIKSVTIAHDDTQFLDDINGLKQYIFDEINVIDINFRMLKGMVSYQVIPDQKVIGTKYRKNANKIKVCINNLTSDDVNNIINNDIYPIVSFDDTTCVLEKDDLTITHVITYDNDVNEVLLYDNDCIVIGNFTMDDTVVKEHILKLFNYHVQQMRKEAKLQSVDTISIKYHTSDVTLHNILHENESDLMIRLKAKIEYDSKDYTDTIISKNVDINGNYVNLHIFKDLM